MQKVLISGIGGFSGRYFAAELSDAGYEVIGTGLSPAIQDQSFEYHQCDMCDLSQVISVVSAVSPNIALHLAGISFAAHDDVDEIYRSNIIGARNLLKALSDLTVRPSAVLLASSANVYGNANTEVLQEFHPLMPANDYAISKLAMEHMARLWQHLLPITIVRPFNYTGIGQSDHFLLPKIVGHFKRRAPSLELGNLNVVRDFSDVRFVASCYRKILDAGNAGRRSGEAFNICSERGYSLAEILAFMTQISGYEMPITVNPAFVRSNEVIRLVGSRFKFDQAFGKSFPPPIDVTLRWMYDHWADDSHRPG